jgi:hypothetical protein
MISGERELANGVRYVHVSGNVIVILAGRPATLSTSYYRPSQHANSVDISSKGL